MVESAKDFDAKVLGKCMDHHVEEKETETFLKCRRSSMDLMALKAQVRKSASAANRPLSMDALEKQRTVIPDLCIERTFECMRCTL